MFKTDYFGANGVRIHYAESESVGDPFVLLHGGSARWQSCESIMDDLAQTWHLFAPDLRGHGLSDHVPGHYRLLDNVSDMAAFLRGVVKVPAIVFGHSWGAQIALMLTAHHPELVRAVILGDTPFSLDRLRRHLNAGCPRVALWRDLAGSRLSIEQIALQLKDVPIEAVDGTAQPARKILGEDNPWFAWMAETLKQHDPTMLTAIMDDFENTYAGFETNQLFPQIQCPVLVIQADPDHGGLLTDTEVQHAMPLMQRGQHVKLMGISHTLHNENPAAVLNAIHNFLDDSSS